MRMAIIGCTGHIGYALETLRACSGLELTALAPGSPAEEMSGLVGQTKAMGVAPRVHEDWRTLLDSERADVAVVAPWFCDSAEISMECLKRGVSVYSEKPLATTHESLFRLEETWKASGCGLDGMFGLRYCPWFLAVRKAVQDGEIGQVRQIHGQKSYRMGQRGPLYHEQRLYGGILPWVGIHAMDWAIQLGGECRRVYALHSRQENRGHGEMEVSSAALMELENGVIATVTADFLRPDGSARHDDDRLRVTGTRGMIEAADGRVFLENEEAKRELTLPDAPAPMADFLSSLGTQRRITLARAALHVTKTALDARESANRA